MTIEAIAAIDAASLTQSLAAVPRAPAADSAFSTLLDSVQGLNQQMHANDQAVQALALGQTDNLHQVMMDMERTRLTFDLLLQVRNKTLEAYQELMRMQV
jgi:flagellar hook-basal body complex protein FliE